MQDYICITNFIGAIMLAASLNALYHHVMNVYIHKKNPESIACRTTGRIKNFKTGKSEEQYGPSKSY